METLSYYDTHSPSAFFPMSRRAIASCIGKGNRDADIHHINSRYGVMSKMPVGYGARDGEVEMNTMNQGGFDHGNA